MFQLMSKGSHPWGGGVMTMNGRGCAAQNLQTHSLIMRQRPYTRGNNKRNMGVIRPCRSYCLLALYYEFLRLDILSLFGIKSDRFSFLHFPKLFCRVLVKIMLR